MRVCPSWNCRTSRPNGSTQQWLWMNTEFGRLSELFERNPGDSTGLHPPCRSRWRRAVSTHLHLNWQSRSPQYVKAKDASFPSDRWPPTKIVEPDGTVRLVLKDGTQIHRTDPPPETLKYKIPTDWERPS